MFFWVFWFWVIFPFFKAVTFNCIRWPGPGKGVIEVQFGDPAIVQAGKSEALRRVYGRWSRNSQKGASAGDTSYNGQGLKIN